MKGYKAFNKGLICRGKQYAENTIFEEESEIICNKGMHFCKNPFDTLKYYRYTDEKGNISDFAEVEALAPAVTDDEIKYCTTKLKIGAKLSLAGFINAGVNFILDRVDKSEVATNTGYYSAATNTGNKSAATNTGNKSAATNTGYYSAATNTGDYSAAANTGYKSAATNTGDYSAAANTGYRSAAANTGNKSAATNIGDFSIATNTGYYSAAAVEGTESIAIVTGVGSKARGALGCWIGCAEWDSEGKHIINFKSHKVDGKTIKSNTYYMLKGGKFVEVKEGLIYEG